MHVWGSGGDDAGQGRGDRPCLKQLQLVPVLLERRRVHSGCPAGFRGRRARWAGARSARVVRIDRADRIGGAGPGGDGGGGLRPWCKLWSLEVKEGAWV